MRNLSSCSGQAPRGISFKIPHGVYTELCECVRNDPAGQIARLSAKPLASLLLVARNDNCDTALISGTEGL